MVFGGILGLSFPEKIKGAEHYLSLPSDTGQLDPSTQDFAFGVTKTKMLRQLKGIHSKRVTNTVMVTRNSRVHGGVAGKACVQGQDICSGT